MTTIDFHFNEPDARLIPGTKTLGNPYYDEHTPAGDGKVYVSNEDVVKMWLVLPNNSTRVDGFVTIYLNDMIPLGTYHIAKLEIGQNKIIPVRLVKENEPLIKKGDHLRMELKCESVSGTTIYRVQLLFALMRNPQ